MKTKAKIILMILGISCLSNGFAADGSYERTPSKSSFSEEIYAKDVETGTIIGYKLHKFSAEDSQEIKEQKLKENEKILLLMNQEVFLNKIDFPRGMQHINGRVVPKIEYSSDDTLEITIYDGFIDSAICYFGPNSDGCAALCYANASTVFGKQFPIPGISQEESITRELCGISQYFDQPNIKAETGIRHNGELVLGDKVVIAGSVPDKRQSVYAHPADLIKHDSYLSPAFGYAIVNTELAYLGNKKLLSNVPCHLIVSAAPSLNAAADMFGTIIHATNKGISCEKIALLRNYIATKVFSDGNSFIQTPENISKFRDIMVMTMYGDVEDTQSIPINILFDRVLAAATDKKLNTEGITRMQVAQRSYELDLENLLRTQIRLVNACNAKTFITGLFGCGTFGGDYMVLAKLYGKVLSEEQGKISDVILADDISNGVDATTGKSLLLVYREFSSIMMAEYMKGKSHRE